MLQLPGPIDVSAMSGGLASSRSAKLILIRPRNFQMQAKRPLIYNFDGNLMDRTLDAVKSAAITGDKMPMMSMLNDPMVLSSVKTSANPTYGVDVSRLSNHYTFMLIVDNDVLPGQVGISSQHQNRTVYYGVCMDEPINPIAVMGRHAVNLAAMLMITHKTVIHGQNNWSGNGFGTRLTTTVDSDVFSPKYAQGISTDDKTALIRPEDLSSYTFVDARHNLMKVMGEKQLIAGMTDPVQIANCLSVPKQNLSHILGGIIRGYQSSRVNEISGMPGFGDDEDMTNAVAANMRTDNVMNRIGLSERELITMGLLKSRYDPEVVHIDPTETPVGLANQAATSIPNIFASMLMSIVPSIIADMGLGHLGFIYDSYRPGDVNWTAWGAFSTMTQMEMTTRARLVLNRLEVEVFPILLNSHGHFRLNSLFVCGGISRCNINFYDDAILNTDYFEVPHVLGGLTSNLWADVNTAANNSLEYNNLLSMLYDADRMQPISIAAEDKLQSNIAAAFGGGNSMFGGYTPDDHRGLPDTLSEEQLY